MAGRLLGSVATASLITLLYYVAPLDRGFGALSLGMLLLGLVLFGGVVAWQVAAITRAEHPRLRAVEALITAIPLFLVLFAASYYLLALEDPGAFSEPLDRTDALYFTVAVFATVGFGDIAPVAEVGRALVTAQMVADLVVVGGVAKILVGAAKVGMHRLESPDQEPGSGPDPGPEPGPAPGPDSASGR